MFKSYGSCFSVNELADEEVDIGGDDPPVPIFPPVVIEKDPAPKSSKCSSSSSSSSDSGSSSSGPCFPLSFFYFLLLSHHCFAECLYWMACLNSYSVYYHLIHPIDHVLASIGSFVPLIYHSILLFSLLWDIKQFRCGQVLLDLFDP